MGNPSRVVAAEPPVPGVLINTEDMLPPYIPPSYNATRNNREGIVSILNVKGKARATPKEGPIPGIAPMMMPASVPNKIINKFNGLATIVAALKRAFQNIDIIPSSEIRELICKYT
jgi:hypothetical protein